MKILNIFKITISRPSGASDPVCGMGVDLDKSKYKSTYQSKAYGFCSSGCKEEFDKNPKFYIR